MGLVSGCLGRSCCVVLMVAGIVRLFAMGLVVGGVGFGCFLIWWVWLFVLWLLLCCFRARAQFCCLCCVCISDWFYVYGGLLFVSGLFA